jgi:selenide,water dikinase
MKVLEGLPLREDRLLVGPESLDDAGVYALDQNTALIQTVDFFTPLVDDPYDFGAVAAANALSDVYAMGGVPLTALAVVCFPAKGVDLAIMRHMLLGGFDKIREAGAAVAGGHTVTDKEIKFGFAVTGIVKPSQIVRVSGARAGDSLVLTKPLGTGVLAHALKAGVLSEKARDAFVASMKELNAAAREAMLDTGANACTDVTGFGLLGHALNIARSSKVTLLFRPDRIQFFPEAPDLVTKKMCPGGLNRTREYVTPYLETRARGPALELLFDPQTSGGLLISVPADRCQDLLAALKEKGVVCAAAIGEVREREGPYLIVE